MRKTLSIVCLIAFSMQSLAQVRSAGSLRVTGSWSTTNTGVTQNFIYVSPSGNDANTPCTTDVAPCQTITGAQTALESLVPSTTAQDFIVYFHNGAYTIPVSWTLGSADSGNSSLHMVTWAEYPGDTSVKFTGGVEVSGVTACTDNSGSGDCPNIPALTGGSGATSYKIYYKNLASATYGNFEAIYYNGERRSQTIGTPTTFLTQGATVCVSSRTTNCHSVGVCPGTGGMNFSCTDRLTRDPDTSTTFHDLTLGDVELLGFEKWTAFRARGAASNNGVGGVNPCTTTSGLMCFTGQMTDSGNFDSFGPILNHRYLVMNARENLTYPKFFYLDRCPTTSNCTVADATMKLYYAADVTAGEDPTTATITIPQREPMLSATALKNFAFDGIQFMYSNYLVPAAGQPGNGGEPDIPASLSFNQTVNVQLNHCFIGHTNDWGIEFIGTGAAGSGAGPTVQNCWIGDTGSGWIRVGKAPAGGDTTNNVPQYGTFYNILMDGAQRVFPGGIGAFWFGNAHDFSYSHIEMHNTYNGGVGMGSCLNVPCTMGTNYNFNNKGSYILGYDLTQYMSSDTGLIHFTSSDGTGNSLDNFIGHDLYEDLDSVGYGGHCIYIDGESTHLSITNGLCYRSSGSALINNDGTDNHIDNVILSFFGGNRTASGFGFKSALDNTQSLATANSAPFEYLTHSIIFTGLGNAQFGMFSHSNNPNFCTFGNPIPNSFAFDNNIWWQTDPSHPVSSNTQVFFTQNAIPCASSGNTNYSFHPGGTSTWQTSAGVDLHSITQDPLFVDPYYDNGLGDNFNFQGGSPYATIGFTPINYSAIGLANLSVIPTHPTLVPLTFPQAFSIDKNTGWGNH